MPGLSVLPALIRPVLPYLIGLALLALAGLAAWQWITGLGHRAHAQTLQVELADLRSDLANCRATASSRLMQIEAQNVAVQKAREDGERRRKAALAARDGALARLEDTQARYNRLRESWPQGCVEAVARVRQEYGL